MKKLWSGRFQEATAASVEKFTESISFDWRLWPYDIMGSIAHAAMLAKQKIISRDEARSIVRGLEKIASEIQSGRFTFDPSLEDIHMNIERVLIKKTGAAGGKLHTARSRNDQVALDLRMYLRQETGEIIRLLKKLQKVLLRAAKKHINTLMPGYTHLQRAQPVVLAHHILAYVEMFTRDVDRYEGALTRINVFPLGACALAGTSLPIDRAYVAKLLGFKEIAGNSMDAVSDRDFALEFLSASSIAMMHMSRMAEELVLWSSGEFSFIEIPDAFATGSSIMPQKKNPDVAELIRGKTGRIYGNLMSLLTMMKALPLTYNRDMQEDKVPLFDTVDTIKGSLTVLIDMYPAITVNRKAMAIASSAGYAAATDIAEYLVTRGMPFRDAHRIVGKLVRYCIDRGIGLEAVPFEMFKELSPLFKKDIYQLLSAQTSVQRKRSLGGTAPEAVVKQIRKLEKSLR